MDQACFIAPTSFAQQRLWFEDQLKLDSTQYNARRAYRILGSLNVEAFQRALDELVARHEALRTTFALEDGKPVQVIAETGCIPIETLDLTHLSGAKQEAEVKRLMTQDANCPFDLQYGPLLRVTLLQLAADHCILLLTLHHIIADGWSMAVLGRELERLYGGFINGQSPTLPELPIQYADYAVWQRDWLQGEALEEQLSYWKRHLAGAPPVLELPSDRPRPTTKTQGSSWQRIILSGNAIERLNTVSRQEGATLFMTMLAAFQTLLYRYSGQEDIVIGTPMGSRQQAETEGVVGCFINMLALRTDLSGEPSFRQLLGRVKEVALGAYAHQDLPFDKLVEELQPQRSLNQTPLFQVVLVLQNTPDEPLRLPGLTIEQVMNDREYMQFDLCFTLRNVSAGLELLVDYSKDLFDDATIRRMLNHFELLLESIGDSPDLPISRLPLLSEEERHKVVVEWNDTCTDYPRNTSIPQLFEEQVERTPNAVAVVFEGQQLTYSELNARANQVAHYLIRQGVEPGTLVGLCIERSLEMVVGILGILKAGGAYVPLDPSYPQERLTFMLEDTQIPVLLTQSSLLEALPPHQAQCVCLDIDWMTIALESQENPAVPVAATNLAYVMFTSGSTGKPKGVSIPHRGVVRLVKETDYVSFAADEVFLQFAPISFDASTFEVWGPLLNGARVVVFPPHTPTLEELGQFIHQNKITTLWLTSALFSQMVDEQIHYLGNLRQLLAGGDVLPVPHVRMALQQLPGCQLINGFGPTESTTFTCCYRFPASYQSDRPVPIGRPIANTQVYVLDKHLQTTPIGIPGELYIGGDGLAREYLNRPELTAERFVPDPFDSEPGARLYKTGDLVRYREDGNLEFIGRLDYQIKLRGFRIELGEIEARLREHTAVQEAVIVVREDEPGEKRLVAYLVSASQPAPSVTELRDFLAQKLPEYMLPAAFVALEALPLSPNGKLDRKALPAPDSSRPEIEADFAQPRTEVEQTLANIWAEVLQLDQVGLHDDFFELGGHSLLAIQVISRAQKAFDVSISLQSLFDAPTIAELAEKIEVSLPIDETMQAPPIRPVSRERDLPLSFAQQRLWFVDQMQPGTYQYNVPYAMRLLGPLKVEALHHALQTIVDRHEVLRTTFANKGGDPVQVIVGHMALPLPVTDLTPYPKEERETQANRLMMEEIRRPFDLSRGPMLRASLLRLDHQEHLLILTMHHIVTDAWSYGVFTKELSTLYEGYAAGSTPTLPPLAIQYADYAAWQRDWLQGDALEKKVSYWRKQLAGAPTVTPLPTDRPRSAVRSARGKLHTFRLSPALSEQILALSRQEGATLFMTLCAAFKTLLYRISGGDDVVVGTDVAKRNQPELEGLIGFFVDHVVLRTDLSGDPTFRQLLERERKVATEAFANQEVPFDRLVEALNPERGSNYTPLFQILFVLQNAPRASLELSDLTLCPVWLEAEYSKFDLGLFMMETEQGITGTFVYKVELFEESTISRMGANFETLLTNIAAQPDTPIGTLDYLSEADKLREREAAQEQQQAKLDRLRGIKQKIRNTRDAS